MMFLFLFIPWIANADAYQVFGVKSDFPMRDGQNPLRDVYVNIGTDQGIKNGSHLDAYRTISTVDDTQQKVGPNFSFKFAKLKVLHADSKMAVARVIEFLPVENIPLGQYTNIMVGDRVEVTSK